MTVSGNSLYSPLHKKLLKPDFIGFALCTLVFWIVLLYATGHSIADHSPHDQHTAQAQAWSQGRITMDRPGDERAEYKGKVYISFPPVPSFFELPLVLLFGGDTPNTLTLLLFTWISMLLSFFVLEKLTGSRTLSFFGSFSFFWGSQALYLSLSGAVWHQGQLFGVFFAVSALLVLLYAEKPLPLLAGGLFLGLAVGCRPYYLVMAIFYIYWAYRRFPRLSSIVYVLAGLAPPGIFYAVYNLIRFDSIFEFGHKYIFWYQEQKESVLGLKNLCGNIFYALANLPEWDIAKRVVAFNGMGTSLFIVAPMLFTGFVYFFKCGIPILEKIVSAVSLFAIWFLLLLHDTNGWFQFGYRFSVDLLPMLLFFFGRTFTKDHWYLIPVSVLSIIVNIYGSFWFYVFYTY